MKIPFFELPAGKFTFVLDGSNKTRIKCLEGDERFVPKLETLYAALRDAKTKEERIDITKKIMNVGGVNDYLESDADADEDDVLVPIY